MAFEYNIKGLSQIVPWFIYDMSNKTLITSVTVPTEIKDTKGVVLSETAVAGLNYKPVQFGGGENRHVSFSIEIIKRNNTVGNTLIMKSIEGLRNQASGLTGIFSGQFQPNPKVLYYWGTGSVPLEWYVKKCDWTNYWVNEIGNPQRSVVEFELILDEGSLLYKAEEIYRKIAGIAGSVENAYNTKIAITSNRSPF
jgi:hypothetical protein